MKKYYGLHELAALVALLGATSAVVTHEVNENAEGWYNYWRNLNITFYRGKVTRSVRVGYSTDDKWRYDDKNVTGRALSSEREAVSILRGLGLEVTSQHEDQNDERNTKLAQAEEDKMERATPVTPASA